MKLTLLNPCFRHGKQGFTRYFVKDTLYFTVIIRWIKLSENVWNIGKLLLSSEKEWNYSNWNILKYNQVLSIQKNWFVFDVSLKRGQEVILKEHFRLCKQIVQLVSLYCRLFDRRALSRKVNSYSVSLSLIFIAKDQSSVHSHWTVYLSSSHIYM